MELMIRNGDYVPDSAGGLRCVSGQEALLQRVFLRLTARREQFPFRPEFGSRLWQLGQLPPSARQAAAKQYVAEALAEEEDLTVEQVTLRQNGNTATLTAELRCNDILLPVTVGLQL